MVKLRGLASFLLFFILFVLLYLSNYTAEGVTVAPKAAIAGVVPRVQVRRAEAQAARAVSTACLNLPVEADVTSVAQITIAVVVVASADEGEEKLI